MKRLYLAQWKLKLPRKPFLIVCVLNNFFFNDLACEFHAKVNFPVCF